MFQMYVFRDRKHTEKLIARCEKYDDMKALVITIDSPVLGRREQDIRNKFNPKGRGVEIVNWQPPKEDNHNKPANCSGQQSAAVAKVSSRIG